MSGKSNGVSPVSRISNQYLVQTLIKNRLLEVLSRRRFNRFQSAAGFKCSPEPGCQTHIQIAWGSTDSLLFWAGLQELFQGPDLRGISDESLVVSSVQHQSTMELSEAGVEAAAATSTAMTRMSLSSFTVNRPFIFFIMEDTIGMPLFVGSVRNPNPSAEPQLQEQQDSPDNRLLGRNDKADFRGGKTFGPDLKFAPRLYEEDYPQFSTPK